MVRLFVPPKIPMRMTPPLCPGGEATGRDAKRPGVGEPAPGRFNALVGLLADGERRRRFDVDALERRLVSAAADEGDLNGHCDRLANERALRDLAREDRG